MPLTPQEKAERKRQRMIEKAKEYQLGTYSAKFVAPTFQTMIRAEAGLMMGPRIAVVNGVLRDVWKRLGECVCVTCGKTHRWDSGIKGMHTGHFISSRRNSVLYDENNVAPQCSHCNVYLNGSPQAFRKWMEAVRGEDVIKRLEVQKTESWRFSREELVDMRIEYDTRIKAAVKQMEYSSGN